MKEDREQDQCAKDEADELPHGLEHAEQDGDEQEDDHSRIWLVITSTLRTVSHAARPG